MSDYQYEYKPYKAQPKPVVKGDEAVIEIRAGAGGDEAALFAAEIFNMYKKYAALSRWKFDLIDSSQNSIGGFKSATFEVDGLGAFEKMKFESGVHRVQRVPETEKSGRVHTSTITVAVLPKATESELVIRPDELEVSFSPPPGAGGGGVNKKKPPPAHCGILIINIKNLRRK